MLLMLFQIRFVLAILFRQNIGWSAQQRQDRSTRFADAASAHGMQTLIGITAGLISWFYVPAYFWWFLPVLCGMLTAIPLSMLSSSANMGRIARRLGLLLTPAETQVPQVLQYLHEEQLAAAQRQLSAADVLRSPEIFALHSALLPVKSFSRREQHHAGGLLYKLMEEGVDSLETHELREIFSQPAILQEFHVWVWSQR